MWLPRLVCPYCAAYLAEAGRDEFACAVCRRRFERRNGSYRFVAPERLEAARPFLDQYRAVREREGYRESSPRYYQMLPYVPSSDRRSAEWRLRRESYQRLLWNILPGCTHDTAVRVLDLGAGNCWLSHRLGALGCRVVAVDWIDDERDGLGACRHYTTTFPAIQADFDQLPFGPFQFELVVFNASLHYSRDVAVTLGHARRMLAPGGSLVVMDSPLFRRARDGEAMVADMMRRFRNEYKLADPVRTAVGFLTFDELARAADALGLRAEFHRTRGPFGWRLRRMLAPLRLRRHPAAFGLWVAR